MEFQKKLKKKFPMNFEEIDQPTKKAQMKVCSLKNGLIFSENKKERMNNWCNFQEIFKKKLEVENCWSNQQSSSSQTDLQNKNVQLLLG